MSFSFKGNDQNFKANKKEACLWMKITTNRLVQNATSAHIS